MHLWLERILHHGLTAPETPAIVLIDRVVTYGMLRDAVLRCADRLAGIDLPRSGPVAVLLENPIRLLTISFALHKIGRAPLPLEPGQAAIRGLSVAATLCDAATRAEAPIASTLTLVEDDWFGAPRTESCDRLPGSFTLGDDICRYALTSGSTGQPKLVAFTVDYLAKHMSNKLIAELLPSRNAVMVMHGLSSNIGFATSCAVLVAGRTLHIAEGPAYAVRMIDLYRVDTVRASPEQLLALTRVAKRTRARLDSLQLVLCGGNRPSRILLEQALTHVCRRIEYTYGSSETGRIAAADATDILAHPGLVGFPMPDVEVVIRGANMAALPAGEIGEIAIRKPVLTASALAGGSDGWAVPGDVGWRDETGRLFVTGRSADEIGAAKGLSTALETEHLFKLETDVDDAAAIEGKAAGASDHKAISIAVVGAHTGDPRRLEDMLKQREIDCRLRIVPVPVIPRGLNGKVRRGELLALLATLERPPGS